MSDLWSALPQLMIAAGLGATLNEIVKFLLQKKKLRSDTKKVNAEAAKTDAEAAQIIATSAANFVESMEKRYLAVEKRAEMFEKRAEDLEQQLVAAVAEVQELRNQVSNVTKELAVANDELNRLREGNL